MALTESDRDTDLIDLSETDDEMLYRLASPVDHNDESDNLSNEDDYSDDVEVLPTRKSKAKLSNRVRHVGRSRKKPVGGQASVMTKMGKLRKGTGKHGKSRTNGQNTLQSNSPCVSMNGNTDREPGFPDQYPNGNAGRTSHESPSPSPQSAGDRGNFSDHSPRDERLSRARRSEMPDEILVSERVTKEKQPNLAPRDRQSGGWQQNGAQCGARDNTRASATGSNPRP